MRESLQMQPSYNQNKANKIGLDKTIEGQKVILKKQANCPLKILDMNRNKI